MIDVVVHRDVEQAAGRHQLFGHRPIVRRRHGITARVIVHEDDRRGAFRDRLAKHLARVHERGVQDPARDRHVPFQPMLRIQYRHVKLLDRQVFQPRGEDRHHVPGRPHGRPILARFGRHPASQFEGRVDRHRAHQSYPTDRT